MLGWTRRAVFLPVAVFSLFAAGCGSPAGVATTPSTPTPVAAPVTVQRLPERTTLSAPDRAGPIAAVVWGTFGQFETAPLVAIDESGRTLAHGAWPGEVRDVSVCPESRKSVVLASDTYGRRVVSVWDLTSFTMGDTWPVDRPVWAVRCVSGDGRRSLLSLPPAGMDPSPPTSLGPTTTVPAPVGRPAAGSNSWSILELDHGVITTLYDAGEYGKVMAFTSRWVIASHDTTLWIVDLAERPPHATVLETTFPARAAINPSGSAVVIAGHYPNSDEPVRLSLFRLGPTPGLIAERTIDRATDLSAWTTPIVWLDADRFIRGNIVYDRDLEQVDSRPLLLRRLAIGDSSGFGVESAGQWKDTLVRIDTATGETTPAQTFVGTALGIVAVSGGPSVTAEAHAHVPEPTTSPPPDQPPPTVPPIMVQLPRVGNVDHSTLEDLRRLVVDADGDGDRIRAEVEGYASGSLVWTPSDEIDSCSGIGFAAGASVSQALGRADIAGRTVIVYAFTNADSVTVAAIDPTDCEVLDTVGPLFTSGPGVNITTTITAP